MAWLIAGQTWLQTYSTDQYRGRVFGAFGTYAALMGLLGMGFATLAGESFGVLSSLTIAAVLFVFVVSTCMAISAASVCVRLTPD